MQTGFDILEYDATLRKLWGKRVIANLIDIAITSLIAIGLGYIFKFPAGSIIFMWQGIVWFIYSAIFDAINGKTPGRYAMGLKAVSFIGSLDIWKAIGRNATKLSWIIFIADVVAGLATEGDPRQRFSERILDSLVVWDHRFHEERKTRQLKIEEDKEEFELPE